MAASSTRPFPLRGKDCFRAIVTPMQITPYRIELMRPPQDDLLGKIARSSLSITEGDLLAISSKVVSLWQGRCVPVGEGEEKDVIAKREAQEYLERDSADAYPILHTITRDFLISAAGIDTSNAGGYYVLWPEHPQESARELRDFLCAHYAVSDVGIIITDSHSVPLRRGAIGFALAYSGFSPLIDYRGTMDLFDREYKIEVMNAADALAAARVFAMGEGAEQTPLARIRDVPHRARLQETPNLSFTVSKEDDLYARFWRNQPWQDGGASR